MNWRQLPFLGRIAQRKIVNSLWFVPSILTFMGIVLGVASIWASLRLEPFLTQRFPAVMALGPEGARGTLIAIAGSMINVAGVAFSITIVVLSLASTQYTPRILRRFMNDRASQAVLGILVGIFAYCIVVLNAIRSGESEFVPILAVAVATFAGIAGIGAVIYFIHHTAQSIEASNIIARLTHETITAIDVMLPEELGTEDSELDEVHELPYDHAQNWTAVRTDRLGYIQEVDTDTLRCIATKANALIRLERRVGEFVAGEVSDLMSVSLSEGQVEGLRASLLACVSIGEFRTVDQDVSYGMQQIVDIALKALSPGINDVTTAEICVVYLGAILEKIARRRMPSRFMLDDKSRGLTIPSLRFEELLNIGVEKIRHYASEHPSILQSLIQILTCIEGRAPRVRRSTLRESIKRVLRTAKNLADRDAAFEVGPGLDFR